MQPEIEAKFLGIEPDEIRRRLRDVGAELVSPMRTMYRKNFDYEDGSLGKKQGWVRLRNEGGEVTLAYKQLDNRGIDGTKEVSVTVGNFADTEAFLKSIGLVQVSYQETKRESWRIGEVQVEIDEWPWVSPFVEIEAPDADMVFEAAENLGFAREKALHGSVEIVYTSIYDVTEQEVDDWPEITFTKIPQWLEEKRR